jgi:NHL repeat-containing protein
MQQKLRRTIVKKSIFAVLLIACFVSVAFAADRTSVVRPGIVQGTPIGVHPFINVKAIQASGTIAVSDYLDGVINLYDTTGKQTGQITGLSGPQGMAADAKGNLYVANTNTGQIFVYAKPYNKAPKMLTDTGYYPAGVAVYSKGKNTWVAASNICSNPSCGQGGFTIFKNGKAGKPITSSAISRVYFLGFDAKGNIYADGETSAGGVVVVELAKAISGGKTVTALTTSNSISFPGGVQVSSKGLIAIDDQLGAAVYSYKAPVKGSLGSPVDTTPITGSSDPVTFAFTSTDKDLWTADAGLAAADEFAYPAGGSDVMSIAVGGEPIGVAVVPAQKP